MGWQTTRASMQTGRILHKLEDLILGLQELQLNFHFPKLHHFQIPSEGEQHHVIFKLKD